MEWEVKTIDLGTIKAKVKREVVFKVKEKSTKKILNIDSSCGCSIPKWDKEALELRVEYKPGSVPTHLLKEGKNSYKSSKMIFVRYDDGTDDVLNFTAIVTK